MSTRSCEGAPTDRVRFGCATLLESMCAEKTSELLVTKSAHASCTLPLPALAEMPELGPATRTPPTSSTWPAVFTRARRVPPAEPQVTFHREPSQATLVEVKANGWFD